MAEPVELFLLLVLILDTDLVEMHLDLRGLSCWLINLEVQAGLDLLPGLLKDAWLQVAEHNNYNNNINIS